MNPASNPTLIPALLEAAVRALVGALAVYAGLRIFRVSNVLAQKAAWCLVLAASLLMPLLMRWQGSVAIKLPVPAWRHAPESLPAVVAASISVPTSAPSSEPAPQFSAASDSGAATGNRFPAPSISISKFNPPAPDRQIPVQYPQVTSARGSTAHFLEPSTVAMPLYLAVCAALLLRMMYGLAKALKIWKSAKPIFPDARRQFAHDMRLRSSKAVSSPVTIGFGVVLPADYVEWDAEKLRIVLAHENSHIRQGDFYLQLLAGVYAAVFWFSPLGWWLKRKLSELGEAISDRAGLEEAASSASYAQILLEFAALPRPTLIGVAMARNSNLSHRIERLLNESSFRQAFAGSRRTMLAVLLVPAALFAATALVRVEAAQSPAPAPLINSSPQQVSPAAAQQSADASLTGQSKPDQAQDEASPTQQNSTAPPPPAVLAAPAPPSSTGADVTPEVAPTPPPPPSPPNSDDSADRFYVRKTVNGFVAQSAAMPNGYSYHWSSNGDSWALVTDRSEHVTFSGDWHNGTKDIVEKVRSQGHEKFLLFTHEGKSYFVDDPAVVAQIEAMYKPMEELGRQQEELGKQQEALGKQQEELGRKQEMVTIPAPDMSKEMAELKATLAAAMAKLDAEKAGALSQQELSDLQGKMGAIQGRLGEIEGKMGTERGKFGEMQGKLGEQQGKLGAEQGRLGAEQGRIAAEADQKVRQIITESLSNGKARPVE
jgi:beta-lactamase regulating signal transducer with metallopeptidase domain